MRRDFGLKTNLLHVSSVCSLRPEKRVLASEVRLPPASAENERIVLKEGDDIEVCWSFSFSVADFTALKLLCFDDVDEVHSVPKFMFRLVHSLVQGLGFLKDNLDEVDSFLSDAFVYSLCFLLVSVTL